MLQYGSTLETVALELTLKPNFIYRRRFCPLIFFTYILHERLSNSLPRLHFIIPSSFCCSPYFQTHVYRQELNIRNRKKRTANMAPL